MKLNFLQIKAESYITSDGTLRSEVFHIVIEITEIKT